MEKYTDRELSQKITHFLYRKNNARFTSRLNRMYPKKTNIFSTHFLTIDERSVHAPKKLLRLEQFSQQMG